MPTIPQPEVTPQWTTFLDLNQDLKPWLQIPAAATAYDAQLRPIMDMACQWVQNYLGRPIAPTRFFRRFSGWSGFNGSYIDLPYYPVLQINTVTEWWGMSGAHTLTEQTPGNQGSQDVYQLDAMRGTLIRTFMGLVQRPWFPGSRNIEVDWIAGFDPLPADIKMATLELAQHWYRNTQEALRTQRPLQEYDTIQQGNLWPAVPNRVTQLLEAYLQVGMA